MQCRATIRVPDGDPPPTWAYAIVRGGKLEYSRGHLYLRREGNGEYQVEGRVRAPSRAGRYRLVIEEVYMPQYQEGDGAHTSTKPEPLFRREHAGPEIQVVR